MKRILPLLVVLCFATFAVACPNCKSSAAVDPTGTAGGGGLPSGFNDSIYFMLGGFFVVLGGIVFVIMKAVRDTNRAGFSVKPVPAQ
jgi:hypothetical protein